MLWNLNRDETNTNLYGINFHYYPLNRCLENHTIVGWSNRAYLPCWAFVQVKFYYTYWKGTVKTRQRKVV